MGTKKKNKPLGFFSKRKLSNREGLPENVISKDTKPSSNKSGPDLKEVWYKVSKMLSNNKTSGNISSPNDCDEEEERCPCANIWTEDAIDKYVNNESVKSQVN